MCYPPLEGSQRKNFKNHYEELNNITKNLVLKLDDMDISDSELVDEEHERKKRSRMMDEKVAEINRKRDEE